MLKESRQLLDNKGNTTMAISMRGPLIFMLSDILNYMKIHFFIIIKDVDWTKKDINLLKKKLAIEIMMIFPNYISDFRSGNFNFS